MWFAEGLVSLILNPEDIRGLLDWWIGFVLMYAASGVLLTGVYLWLFDSLGLSDWERAKKPDREKRALRLHPIEILLYLCLPPLMVTGGILLNIYVYQPLLNP